jgi:FAD binding domain
VSPRKAVHDNFRRAQYLGGRARRKIKGRGTSEEGENVGHTENGGPQVQSAWAAHRAERSGLRGGSCALQRHDRQAADGCVDVADVIAAVNFGRDCGLPIAIRGGGHNGPGLGSVNDGLVIDLSHMKGVRVDPEARTARVAAGCTQGDVDHATHAFGLAVPAGIISTTGIAGLTLSGGHGYLSRKYGLTIDNLLEADVVLADGSFVTASKERNAELLWALRGGGGNFGVVAGPIAWDQKHARSITMSSSRGFAFQSQTLDRVQPALNPGSQQVVDLASLAMVRTVDVPNMALPIEARQARKTESGAGPHRSKEFAANACWRDDAVSAASSSLRRCDWYESVGCRLRRRRVIPIRHLQSHHDT